MSTIQEERGRFQETSRPDNELAPDEDYDEYLRWYHNHDHAS